MGPNKPFQQFRMPGMAGGGYPMAAPKPPSPMYRMPGQAGGQYWVRSNSGSQMSQMSQAQDPLVRAMMARPGIARGGR